jgi:hypothetical protein
VLRSAATLRPAIRDKYLRIIAAELAEAKHVVDEATMQSTVEMVLTTLVDT